MKEVISYVQKLVLTASLLLACIASFAQTSMDTVKPGLPNDPMIVNPGKVTDGMSVKPAPSNDGMSILSDTAFLNKNIMDNRMEIQESIIGRDKGSTPEVKKIAALMVADHTAILNDLESLAAKKQTRNKKSTGMKMPPTNFPEGKAFDQAWAGQMLAMHEAKIAELERFIGITHDAELKAAAIKALPKIKMHRELLLKISGAREKSNSSPTI